MPVKIETFTDEAILRKHEVCERPVITESGECFVVKAVTMYLDDTVEKVAEVDFVNDIAVFATEGEAYAFAGKMTKNSEDSCSAVKHMYTVSCRQLEIE